MQKYVLLVWWYILIIDTFLLIVYFAHCCCSRMVYAFLRNFCAVEVLWLKIASKLPEFLPKSLHLGSVIITRSINWTIMFTIWSMRSRVSHLILHSEKALNAILAKLEHHQKSFSDKKIDDFLARASQRGSTDLFSSSSPFIKFVNFVHFNFFKFVHYFNFVHFFNFVSRAINWKFQSCFSWIFLHHFRSFAFEWRRRNIFTRNCGVSQPNVHVSTKFSSDETLRNPRSIGESRQKIAFYNPFCQRSSCHCFSQYGCKR